MAYGSIVEKLVPHIPTKVSEKIQYRMGFATGTMVSVITHEIIQATQMERTCHTNNYADDGTDCE